MHADSGKLESMQLAAFPQCSLFEQTMLADVVTVRYHEPRGQETTEADREQIQIPLEPDIETLARIDVAVHSSPASTAYAMGESYDSWFSARFGFATRLVYIGDGRREVLGSVNPRSEPASDGGGWRTTLSSILSSPWSTDVRDPWITFTDVAPFLITTEASLADVNARLAGDAEVAMYKFRPNIVVDGEHAWEEDFWAELSVDSRRITLTANCGRCSSINVDYATGRPAVGELGTVLKRMMKDRRVDLGVKYSPIFGRYGFLVDGGDVHVAVGDDVMVTKRRAERTRFEWPGLSSS